MAKKANARRKKKPAIDPARIRPGDLAELLTKAAGEPVAAADVETDIGEGAPANDDGTVSLVNYVAWLVRELERGA